MFLFGSNFAQEYTQLYSMATGLTAGALGGLNIAIVGHPFDTLKVKLQTQPQSSPLYKGVVDCLQKTIKWEGVRGLFAGLASPMIGQILFRSTLFFSHSESKKYLGENGKRSLTTSELFLAGAIGWGVGSVVECPFDVIKSHIQTQSINSRIIPGYQVRYRTVAECARVILQSNGMRGLYQGYSSHLLRNIPAGAIQLGVYDIIRNKWAEMEHIKATQLSMSQNLIAGSIAGVAFWTAVYPIDVVKSSMQSDAIERENRKYRNTLNCVSKLWKEGGLRCFYRGFTPCVMRAIPANAVMLYTVSYVTNYFNN